MDMTEKKGYLIPHIQLEADQEATADLSWNRAGNRFSGMSLCPKLCTSGETLTSYDADHLLTPWASSKTSGLLTCATSWTSACSLPPEQMVVS